MRNVPVIKVHDFNIPQRTINSLLEKNRELLNKIQQLSNSKISFNELQSGFDLGNLNFMDSIITYILF